MEIVGIARFLLAIFSWALCLGLLGKWKPSQSTQGRNSMFEDEARELWNSLPENFNREEFTKCAQAALESAYSKGADSRGAVGHIRNLNYDELCLCLWESLEDVHDLAYWCHKSEIDVTDFDKPWLIFAKIAERAYADGYREGQESMRELSIPLITSKMRSLASFLSARTTDHDWDGQTVLDTADDIIQAIASLPLKEKP